MAHFLCTFLSNSPQCVWARFCLPRNVSILGYTLLLSSRTGSTILHKVCHSNNGRKLFCVVSDRRLSFCVTRFGEISPLWHNVKKLWPFWKSSFCIWKDLELTLANFICFGAFFSFVNAQILKKIIEQSGRTDLVPLASSRVELRCVRLIVWSQCDQIGRFDAIWANFWSPRWQKFMAKKIISALKT